MWREISTFISLWFPRIEKKYVTSGKYKLFISIKFQTRISGFYKSTLPEIRVHQILPINILYSRYFICKIIFTTAKMIESCLSMVINPTCMVKGLRRMKFITCFNFSLGWSVNFKFIILYDQLVEGYRY